MSGPRLAELPENGPAVTGLRLVACAGSVAVLLSAGACGVLAAAPLRIAGEASALFGLVVIAVSIANVGLLLAPVDSRRRRRRRRALGAANAALAGLVLCLLAAGIHRAARPVFIISAAALLVTAALSAACHWWPRVRVTSIICHGCGYDLRGLEASSCPECGRVAR